MDCQHRHPVSLDTELTTITVTKEAGHGNEAKEAGTSARTVERAE